MNTEESQEKETKAIAPPHVKHLIMRMNDNARTDNNFVSIIRKYNFVEIKIIEHNE